MHIFMEILRQKLKFPGGYAMKLMILVGSGRKIGLFTLPFLLAGIVLNVMFPAFFQVGGPSDLLRIISLVVLIPGVIAWIWSVVLILVKVPRKELITTGPFAIAKHPLYTGVTLLVLPWAGFLMNTLLGALIGIVMYVGSRIYAPEEEKILAKIFGKEWEAYCKKVLIPWI
jgi:protein-S-isoprenylcysteine O-methyltransferase Ste14